MDIRWGGLSWTRRAFSSCQTSSETGGLQIGCGQMFSYCLLIGANGRPHREPQATDVTHWPARAAALSQNSFFSYLKLITSMHEGVRPRPRIRHAAGSSRPDTVCG